MVAYQSFLRATVRGLPRIASFRPIILSSRYNLVKASSIAYRPASSLVIPISDKPSEPAGSVSKPPKYLSDEEEAMLEAVKEAKTVGRQWTSVASLLGRSHSIVSSRWNATELTSPIKLPERPSRTPSNKVLLTDKVRFELTVPVQKRRKFRPEEDAAILNEVNLAKDQGREPRWKWLGRLFDRHPSSVRIRWSLINPKLVRGPFTKEEDDYIRQAVEKQKHLKPGRPNWIPIANHLRRSANAVANHWNNHLGIIRRKGPWTAEEDAVIVKEGLEAARDQDHQSGRV
ncbi:hypothetical protein HDV00_001641 [Rhizophlyctis rosea]|nr:hypothetical protein HDV00_001641 [Rhizophlyctis rosea]